MKLKHLTSIKDLDTEQINEIFARATELSSANPIALSTRSEHLFIGNLFFEPSTRTRLSFETAAKRLGMHVLTLDKTSSSRVKGETVLDTILTIEAMGAEAFVIRSSEESVCQEMALAMNELRPHVHIINAGGGQKDHPTQGLLDVFTMQQYFSDLSERKICIVGDIKHSRVARSTVQVLQTIGAGNIHLIAPPGLLPDTSEFSGCTRHDELSSGLQDADIVMALRIQKERMQATDVPDESQYHKHYGLDSAKLSLANDQAIVMHPGPLNRGLEITNELADGQRSVISDQVANGVLIRMAILDLMLS